MIQYNSYRLLEECEVSDIESLVNYPLCSNYKNFLVKNGVGDLSEESNSFFSSGGGVTIDWLWGLNDIKDSFNAYEEIQGLLTIGGDVMGNLFILSPDKSILFFSHDLSPIKGFSESKNTEGLYCITDSFNSFVNSLSPSGL